MTEIIQEVIHEELPVTPLGTCLNFLDVFAGEYRLTSPFVFDYCEAVLQLNGLRIASARTSFVLEVVDRPVLKSDFDVWHLEVSS